MIPIDIITLVVGFVMWFGPWALIIENYDRRELWLSEMWVSVFALIGGLGFVVFLMSFVHIVARA